MNFGYRNRNNVVHAIHRRTPIGNGIDYEMLCGVTYTTKGNWPKAEEGLAPTCLFCVAASSATP